MGGLRKYMPVTWITMMIGWFAICGVPFFAGFFSKDEILWKAWSASSFMLPNPAYARVLWGIGAVTALLTAIYMTRMMVMTFWGTERFRESHQDDVSSGLRHEPHRHEPHESPWVMKIPLIVLAILSTVGGLFGVSYALGSLVSDHPVNYIEETLAPVIHPVPNTAHAGEAHEQPHLVSPPPTSAEGPPVIPHEGLTGDAAHAHSPEEIRQERLLTLVSVVIALLGIGIGWWVFRRRPLLKMPKVLEEKYYVDEAYDAAIINPIEAGSREGLWKLFDLGVIDGFLHSLGRAVTEAGKLLRRLQSGFVRGYAVIILVGALILIGIFAYFGGYALGQVR